LGDQARGLVAADDLNMKLSSSVGMVAALLFLEQAFAPAVSAAEGVALAIVYDTSGSMKDSVRESSGKTAPKFQIANRALIGIARRIETFSTNSTAGPREVRTALFTFRGEKAREVFPLGPFDSEALRKWAKSFNTPSGNTPLGNALGAAARCVLESPLPRKHVLVITDGMNTAGPQPAAVLPGIREDAERRGAALGVHFVAFDVDAKLFEPLKRLGVTVVGAADEAQLNTQLDFILQRKILLEDEEPAKTR
jgi:hypothetical protein